jgi:hypothetical protein
MDWYRQHDLERMNMAACLSVPVQKLNPISTIDEHYVSVLEFRYIYRSSYYLNMNVCKGIPVLNNLTIRVMFEKWGEFWLVLGLSVLMPPLTLEFGATSVSVW